MNSKRKFPRVDAGSPKFFGDKPIGLVLNKPGQGHLSSKKTSDVGITGLIASGLEQGPDFSDTAESSGSLWNISARSSRDQQDTKFLEQFLEVLGSVCYRDVGLGFRADV